MPDRQRQTHRPRNARPCSAKASSAHPAQVSWDFDHLGIIEAEPANKEADAETAAIEAGAQDFEAGDADEDGKVTTTIFYSDATDLDLVSSRLANSRLHGFVCEPGLQSQKSG